MNLRAEAAGGLLERLGEFDISVSGWTTRTTEQVERWSICRFLATYAYTPVVAYPLDLSKRERPDFLLRMTHREVGIEITSALPTDWARIQAEAERYDDEGESDGKNLIFAPRILPDDTSMAKERVENIARGKELGSGWAGSEPEYDWAVHLVQAFLRKRDVLLKPEFDKFERNWLIIYANLPFNAVKQPNAASRFFRALGELQFRDTFDRLFVEAPRFFWSFDSSGFASQEIPDLWDTPA